MTNRIEIHLIDCKVAVVRFVKKFVRVKLCFPRKYDALYLGRWVSTFQRHMLSLPLGHEAGIVYPGNTALHSGHEQCLYLRPVEDKLTPILYLVRTARSCVNLI